MLPNDVISFSIDRNDRQAVLLFKIIERRPEALVESRPILVILDLVLQKGHRPRQVVADGKDMDGNIILALLLANGRQHVDLLDLVVQDGNAAHRYAGTVDINISPRIRSTAFEPVRNIRIIQAQGQV